MTATVDDDDMRRDAPIAMVLVLARLFRRRPGDSVAVLVMVAASLSVVVNALCLQSGPHPAPIFNLGSRPVASGDVVGSVVMAPRPLRARALTRLRTCSVNSNVAASMRGRSTALMARRPTWPCGTSRKQQASNGTVTSATSSFVKSPVPRSERRVTRLGLQASRTTT